MADVVKVRLEQLKNEEEAPRVRSRCPRRRRRRRWRTTPSTSAKWPTAVAARRAHPAAVWLPGAGWRAVVDDNDPHARASDEKRVLTIPYSLMTEFQTRVIAPWHAAWKHFRSSRQRGGASESDPNAALPAMAPPAEGGTAGASAEEELESGDTLFTWGCLDWSTSNLSNLTPKNRERAAFIVPHPDLLAVPPGLDGKRIAMVAAGARHNLLVTHDGECFAWGVHRRPWGRRLLYLAPAAAAHALPRQARRHGRLVRRRAFVRAARRRRALHVWVGQARPDRPRHQRHDNRSAAGDVEQEAVPGGGERLGGRDAHRRSPARRHVAHPRRERSGGARSGGAGGDGDVKLKMDVSELRSVHTLRADKTPVQAASAGGAHTLALTRTNAIFAFGAGSWGASGLAATAIRASRRASPRRRTSAR